MQELHSKLINDIEALRKLLNSTLEKDENNLEEILILSQDLDILITRYYKRYFIMQYERIDFDTIEFPVDEFFPPQKFDFPGALEAEETLNNDHDHH
ncbi:MAG: Spo0E like sporulation regulatory protein [Clostridiales bacterium]|jgi:hypothetical protein|nr:Spo0E like sporulation regulatory protein [Clostridiales bacterium]